MLRMLLVVLLLMPGAALAQSGHDRDHDRALSLRHKGAIMPLSRILQQVSARYPGQTLEVELKERKPHPVYEIERLGNDGVVREVTVDAVDGHIIAVKKD